MRLTESQFLDHLVSDLGTRYVCPRFRLKLKSIQVKKNHKVPGKSYQQIDKERKNITVKTIKMDANSTNWNIRFI